MKTFFQFAEQAKKHRKLQEAGPVAGQPVAAQPVPGQQAAPAVDYKTFGANWTKFSQDRANLPAIQALSKSIPQLAQMDQIIAKMATPAPAAAAVPATGVAPVAQAKV